MNPFTDLLYASLSSSDYSYSDITVAIIPNAACKKSALIEDTFKNLSNNQLYYILISSSSEKFISFYSISRDEIIRKVESFSGHFLILHLMCQWDQSNERWKSFLFIKKSCPNIGLLYPLKKYQFINPFHARFRRFESDLTHTFNIAFAFLFYFESSKKVKYVEAKLLTANKSKKMENFTTFEQVANVIKNNVSEGEPFLLELRYTINDALPRIETFIFA